jgi:predicted transcriptional regulator
MAEPIRQAALTPDEQALIALLRQGPQSVAGLAGALQTSAGQTDDALQRLARKVGLVPLFRYETLRHGLAE